MSITSLLKKFRKPPNKNNDLNRRSEHLNNPIKLSKDMDANMAFLTEGLGNAPDMVVRDIVIGSHRLKAVYLEALVSHDMINSLLHGLMVGSNLLYDGEEAVLTYVKDKTLHSGQVKEINTLGEALEALLFGETLLFFAGCNKALVISTKSWESRAIEESKIEGVLRGPRDAFTENIMNNLALIRRRLHDPNLRVYRNFVGQRTKTSVLIAYLQDVANPEILDEILARLSKVQIDGVLESGILEQLIEDNIYSPFPQIQYSERPDKAVAQLLEGRYVIMVDATPFCLIVPATFAQFVNSPEDYYERWMMSSFIRLIRYIAIFSSMFLPSFYIALTTFHYQLIPSRLVIPLAQARTEVPFTPIVEAVIMEVTIELLREAGIRLPGPVGQTIGVVGGIIIGNAAIQAGLVSPLMVIVVALTAVATFIIPNYNLGLAVRFVRFPFMILTGLFGGYGMVISWLLLTTHLITLESFGVPYFAPFSPLLLKDIKDSVIRLPINFMIKRPTISRAQNTRRQVPKNET